MIEYTNATGGISVYVGPYHIGWIVRTPSGFEFIHTSEVKDSITTKLRELENES